MRPEDIAKLRAMLIDLHSNNVGFKEGALFDAMGIEDGSGPARFPQILHPRTFAPGLIDTPFYRAARTMAEQLLGPGMCGSRPTFR